jgi:hypothetical protein
MKIVKCLPSGEDLNPSNDGSHSGMGIFHCVISGQDRGQRARYFCAEGFDEIMNHVDGSNCVGVKQIDSSVIRRRCETLLAILRIDAGFIVVPEPRIESCARDLDVITADNLESPCSRTRKRSIAVRKRGIFSKDTHAGSKGCWSNNEGWIIRAFGLNLLLY